MKRTTSGFTIVELLIVIVVIAILAAITIVAYNGIQSRANDSRIKTAVGQIEKSIQLYVAEYGPLSPGLGWYGTNPTDGNCTVSAGGWAAKQAYSHNCTLEYVLNEKKLLPDNFMVNLPHNKSQGATTGLQTIMFYRCTPVGSNYFALLWYLESPSPEETSSLNALKTQCGLGGVTYGMQAGKLIQA